MLRFSILEHIFVGKRSVPVFMYSLLSRKKSNFFETLTFLRWMVCLV